MWAVGVGRVGDNNGGKMGTIVIEQQYKKKRKFPNFFRDW